MTFPATHRHSAKEPRNHCTVYDLHELIQLRQLFRRLTDQQSVEPDSAAGLKLGKQLLRFYGYGVRDIELLKKYATWK